jgi:hypothetical protein
VDRICFERLFGDAVRDELDESRQLRRKRVYVTGADSDAYTADESDADPVTDDNSDA